MDNDKKSEKSWSATALAWELGYLIAVPLVFLALFGRYLDKKFNTEPWIFLASIVLAIVFSSYAIYRKAKDIIEK